MQQLTSPYKAWEFYFWATITYEWQFTWQGFLSKEQCPIAAQSNLTAGCNKRHSSS